MLHAYCCQDVTLAACSENRAKKSMYAYTYVHIPLLVSVFIFLSISLSVCLSVYLSIYVCLSPIHGLIPVPPVLIQYHKAHSRFSAFHMCNSLLLQWRLWIPLSPIHLLICDQSNVSSLQLPGNYCLTTATSSPTTDAHLGWLGSDIVPWLPSPPL